jgi:hypothetical protein
VRRKLMGMAMLTFFVLAGVAWAGGCSPWACAMKASAGAILMYVILTFAWKIAVSIIVNAVIESNTKQEGAAIGERRNQPSE